VSWRNRDDPENSFAGCERAQELAGLKVAQRQLRSGNGTGFAWRNRFANAAVESGGG
jgi:hypothetical protein